MGHVRLAALRSAVDTAERETFDFDGVLVDFDALDDATLDAAMTTRFFGFEADAAAAACIPFVCFFDTGARFLSVDDEFFECNRIVSTLRMRPSHFAHGHGLREADFGVCGDAAAAAAVAVLADATASIGRFDIPFRCGT